MFSALRHKTYRRLFAAHVIALVGTGLSTIAIGFLAVDVAGASASGVIGTVLAIKMVSFLVIGPIAPAVARRVGIRRLLILTDLARATVALALPFVDSLLTAYILIFILHSTSALFTPTFQATIPTVVTDKREYTGALALSRLAYDTEALASPTLAGLLLLVMPSSMLFLGTSVGFVASALLILSVVISWPTMSKVTSTRQELLEGVAVMLRIPQLRASLFLQLSIAAAGPVVTVMTVPLARTYLMLNEREAAGLLAVFGLGSVTGAIVMTFILERISLRTFVLGGALLLTTPLTLVWPILMLGADSHTTMVLIGVVWFFTGIGYSSTIAPMGRVIREYTSDEEMPAAFAGQFSLAHGWWIITYPLVGWGAAAIGFGPISLIMVVISAAAILIAVRLWPSTQDGSLEFVSRSTPEESEVNHE